MVGTSPTMTMGFPHTRRDAVTVLTSVMADSFYELPRPLVTVSPDWLGGEPCFTGRRVAVKALFDYVKAGHTLEQFLADFPSVSREHAVAVIELANRAVLQTNAAE
jgi:uncharacterized protein (DUF433 family)